MDSSEERLGFFITGATGNVGYAIAKQFRKEDIKIYALVRKQSPTHMIEKLYRIGCILVEGDLVHSESYSSMLEKVEGVIHTAAYVDPSDPGNKHKQTNVTGTKILVDAMIRAGVRRLVHMSSAGVYGTHQDLPITETTQKNPRSSYSKSKLAAEQYILQQSNLATTIIRCPYIIGPNDRHVIPTLLNSIPMRFSIKILGKEGKNGFVHTRDIANFVILAAARENTPEQIYNLQSESFTLSELSAAVEEARGTDIRYISVPFFLLQIGAFFYNIVKLFQGKERNAHRYLNNMRKNWILDTTRAQEMGWRSDFTKEMIYDEIIELMKMYLSTN